MSMLWWLIAAVLVFGTPQVLLAGSRIIAKRTGREMEAQKPFAYELTYFAISLGVGLPPIFAYPDEDPLFYAAFFFVGIVVGTLVAQAFFGRRSSPNEGPKGSHPSNRAADSEAGQV